MNGNTTPRRAADVTTDVTTGATAGATADMPADVRGDAATAATRTRLERAAARSVRRWSWCTRGGRRPARSSRPSWE